MRKLLALCAILFTLPGYLFAQTGTISGKVVDQAGDPIPFASIVVKGTSTGSAADDNGNFTIRARANQTLVISATGFATREVSASAAATVALESVSQVQDEIVVVAYGQQKKSSLTGAVSTISSKDLEDRLTTNITQALAGAAPGIQTTSGEGQPGSSAAVRIRGFGSLNASNSPLYVVDGFPYEGYIGDISTNDIESITLLKDATSAALYGSRAANGVILITTKKGASGAPKVNVNLLTGYSKRSIPEYETADAYEYYPLYWRAYRNNLIYGAAGLTPEAASQRATDEIGAQLIYNPFNVPRNTLVDVNGKMNPSAKLMYQDFDWFKAMENNGPRNEANFNISSKVNETDYFISLNYVKDNGYLIKSDFERVTARTNVTSKITRWFKAGVNLNGAVVKSNQAAGDGSNTFINPFVFARGIGPIYPIRAWDASGNPILDAAGEQYYDYGAHPGAVNRPTGASPGRHILYETLLNTRLTRRNSLTARAFYELEVIKDLTFTHNIGIDLANTKGTTIQNKIVGDGVTSAGYASRSANEYKTVTMNQLLNYSKGFGDHSMSLLLGHENSWMDNLYFSASKKGSNLDGNTEFVNYVVVNSVGGYSEMLRREGYFGRVNYDFQNKYFFDVSYRRDGSSRFSPKSRWGNFWSAGGAWHINKEDFMKTVDAVSDLKLRVAYGTVGNDRILSGSDEVYYAYQQLYDLGWNNGSAPGALASSLRNDDLTWEVGTNFTAGVDVGLYNNRVTASVEFFKRGSSALLFDVPLGQSSIVTTITRNIGSMENTGVELTLAGDVVRTSQVRWNVSLMATSLKNKITKLPDGKPITSGTKRLEEGRDLYSFYLRQWYGVDPTDGAGLYYRSSTSSSSDYRVIKGDTLVTNPTDARFGYAGSSIPKIFGSLTSSVSYSGVSLSVMLNYQMGGKFYDGNYAGLMTIGSYGKSLHKDLLNSWQKPGDITDIPRVDIAQSSNFNGQSDRFLIDASYIAIRNATLAYTFPRELLSRIDFNTVKVFVTGENLLMSAKRVGLNPMESFSGTNSPLYTPNRIISFGVNLGF